MKKINFAWLLAITPLIPLTVAAKCTTTKPDPVKPDPAKPDPSKPDPSKPDPSKPDPEKTEEEFKQDIAKLVISETYQNEGGFEKIDILELDLSKVKILLNGKEPSELGYEIVDLAFGKPVDDLTEDLYMSGLREIKFKIKKGKFISDEIIRSIQCHKTSKSTILDEREHFKNFKLIPSLEAKEYLETVAKNGDTLYYDYTNRSIYSKDYKAPDKIKLFENLSIPERINVLNPDSEDKTVILSKDENGYSIKGRLAQFMGKNNPMLIDLKTLESSKQKFNIHSPKELEDEVNKWINQIDYKDKATTLINDFDWEKVQWPALTPNINAKVEYEKTNVTKNFDNNSVSIKFKLVNSNEVQSATPIAYKEFEATISGFKENPNKVDFTDLVVDYEGKDAIELTTIKTNGIDQSKIKFFKNNTPYVLQATSFVAEVIGEINEFSGELNVKITLTSTSGETSFKEFSIEGFKIPANNPTSIINDVTIISSAKWASSVTKDNITIKFKDPNHEELFNIEEIKVGDSNNMTGEVLVTIKFVQKATSATFEKTFNLSFTNKYDASLAKLYEFSKQKKLFVIDPTKKEQIKTAMKNPIRGLFVINNNKILNKKKDGVEIEGLSINAEVANSMHLNTHGSGNKANIGKIDNYGSNDKGINVYFEDGKYILRWKIGKIGNGANDSEEVFEQILELD